MPTPSKSELLSKQKVGERIRTLREQRGWSQGRLATALGSHAQNISQIERGVRGVSVQQVVRLARILGISTDEILGQRERDSESRAPDRKLMRRLRRIQELPATQRSALLKMIDGALGMTEKEAD